jgi:hypothetical protein
MSRSLVGKKSSGDIVIKDIAAFRDFIKKIYLRGIFSNCILSFKSGKVFTRCLDQTSSVFVGIVLSGIEGGDYQLGIGNLELIDRFFSLVDQDEIILMVEDNRLIIDRRKHGVLSYLLTDLEMIESKMEDESSIDKLKNNSTNYVELKKEVCMDFLKYAGLSDAKTIALDRRNGQLKFIIGSGKSHKFIIPITKRAGNNFKVKFYRDNIVKIFEAITFTDNDFEHPIISYGEDEPLLVEQKIGNAKVMWAVVPFLE